MVEAGSCLQQAKQLEGIEQMTPIKPIKYPELYSGELEEVEFAKDQPEYLTLPALVGSGPGMRTTVITEWEPTAEELQRLFTGGHVRLRILKADTPLQPVMLDVVGGEGDGAGEE